MEQVSWILWIVLGVALIVAEIFTLGFVLLWFGLGAFAAALVGILGGGFLLQFFAFATVSIGLTAMSRTIFATYFSHDDKHALKYGVDALPGKIGTVSSASKGELNESAVKVFGSTWTAFPIDGETALIEGEKVQVVEIKGSSIYVRRITNELPSWKNE
ncbi:MAG: NfeD family protein [Pyrinomonadaceae bacterium]